MILSRLILGLFSFLALASSSLAEGRRLEVLFLGDNGGHKPAERFPYLYRTLGPKGYQPDLHRSAGRSERREPRAL